VIFPPNFTSESHVRSLGSATARIGYGWDRFLGYVKGGAAWQRDEYDFLRGGVTFSSTGENTRLGWTVGVGGEYAFTNWLSGFVEYDYYNFGNRDQTFAFTVPAGTVSIRETTNVVKAGLNFRFGNWGRAY
jgi:outer membrane immunogenic protein